MKGIESNNSHEIRVWGLRTKFCMDNHTIPKEKVKSELNELFNHTAIGEIVQLRTNEITVSLYFDDLNMIQNRYNTDLGLNYTIESIYKDTTYDYVVNMRIEFTD